MSKELVIEKTHKENPLGTKPIGKLLFSFALPAITANVVNALYNIVDQIFIGQGVGTLGNAATSVSFPLTTLCMAIGLMVGLGSSSKFNLELGRKNEDKAREIAGTAAGMLLICGIIICIIVRLNLVSLLHFFGATDSILPYAKTYAGITSLGIPFLFFSIGTNPMVRADGSAKYSMLAIVIGAVLNTILDPIAIFVFDMGIAGAAWATIISQTVAAVILMCYYPRFKAVHFSVKDFIPKVREMVDICRLGLNSFIFQASNLIVQIVLNNVLRIYGQQSIYGADTPIAVAGIVMKINVIFIALIIGLINGAQPICSYNYGAEKFSRVRETVKLFIRASVIISVVVWIVFEIFPQPIISLFGDFAGNTQYLQFATHYMRIYFMFMFVNGVTTCSITFFPSIGKATRGAILSFSKQIIFLIPLLILLPRVWGLDGILYAQPITDMISFFLAAVFLFIELRKMPKKDLA